VNARLAQRRATFGVWGLAPVAMENARRYFGDRVTTNSPSVFEPGEMKELGFTYYGVGRPQL
jgi:hypothetical protein